jgi:hypothetical protein
MDLEIVIVVLGIAHGQISMVGLINEIKLS